MILYLLRHGETDYNNKHVFQGIIDVPLNEAGRAQAKEAKLEAAGRGLSFDEVFCSPLIRAQETCEIISGIPREKFHLDNRLMEMSFGDLEGTTFNAEKLEHLSDPANYLNYCGEHHCETFYEVADRCGSFLDDMKKMAKEAQDRGEEDRERKILVGSHGAAIRGMLMALGVLTIGEVWGQKVGNCAMFEISLVDEEWKLTRSFLKEDAFARKGNN